MFYHVQLVQPSDPNRIQILFVVRQLLKTSKASYLYMFWAVSKPEALSDAVSQAQSIAICQKTVYRDTVPVKDLNYKSKEDIPNRLLIGDEILQYCTRQNLKRQFVVL